MPGPVTMFLLVHRAREFALAALLCGAVGVVIVGVPLPHAADDMADNYTALVGFYLAPLLLTVPAGMVLAGDMYPHERAGARNLVRLRGLLTAAVCVACFLVLIPAAVVAPVEEAARAMGENLACVLGELFLLCRWLPTRWAWAPITGLALLGLMSQQDSIWTDIAVVNRAPSGQDLLIAVVLLLVGAGLYVHSGTARADDEPG